LIAFHRRLFLDYHGLKLLYKWMFVLTDTSIEDLDLKVSIEDTLDTLSFPHKTMLKESGVLPTIISWADRRQDFPERSRRTSIPAAPSTESSRATTPDSASQSTPSKASVG
jgi:histone-lysine N-methyltransferase SETD2